MSAPAVGQRWRCRTTGNAVTVTAVLANAATGTDTVHWSSPEHGGFGHLPAPWFCATFQPDTPPIVLVCKHAAPGDTRCTMHNLHCSYPHCLEPEGTDR